MMSKTVKYARNGALIGGFGNALINVAKQLYKISENQQQEFSWREVLTAGLKGAAVGGLTGGAIGAIQDYSTSLEEPINTDKAILKAVAGVQLCKTDLSYQELAYTSEKIIDRLIKSFGDKLHTKPFRFGSTEKGTSLNYDFDIDISLTFRPNAFSSTKVMFREVLNEIGTYIDTNHIVEVREQKKSIGIILNIRGNEYRIDIVPTKVTKPGKGTAGYLYVNDTSFFTDNSTYTKTDTLLLNSQQLTATQKKIVVAFKYWKSQNDIPMSGYLIERIVLEAYKYNSNRIPKRFTQKLLMVIDYISTNFDTISIKGVENTNNVLTDISIQHKDIIISSCDKILEDYEYQPNSIVKYFGDTESIKTK
ncbi:MAG TPA: hypothetical protein VD908_18150 [Cytophagales bacterium]|nr:hypothetical protein [Cytophagales bacterium]